MEEQNKGQLTLNEYQEKAMTTRMSTCDNYCYMMGNLIAEVGELSGKVAKAQRKGKVRFDERGNVYLYAYQGQEAGAELERELMLEAGDILWQLAGLCNCFGWDLQDIAQMNLDKLQARKAAGTIAGNGDGISGEERTV